MNLEKTKVVRCFKPIGFSKIKDARVHHFTEASEIQIRQASYLQLVSENNQIHYSLLIGKARVTPTKYVSIQRLELTRGTLSIKMSQLIKRELEVNDVTGIREHFWTDSQVILGYINNQSKRFSVCGKKSASDS